MSPILDSIIIYRTLLSFNTGTWPTCHSHCSKGRILHHYGHIRSRLTRSGHNFHIFIYFIRDALQHTQRNGCWLRKLSNAIDQRGLSSHRHLFHTWATLNLLVRVAHVWNKCLCVITLKNHILLNMIFLFFNHNLPLWPILNTCTGYM